MQMCGKEQVQELQSCLQGGLEEEGGRVQGLSWGDSACAFCFQSFAEALACTLFSSRKYLSLVLELRCAFTLSPCQTKVFRAFAL